MAGLETVVVIAAGGYVAADASGPVTKLVDELGESRRVAVRGSEPVCGCRHHLAHLDPHEGACACYADVRQGKAQ